MLRPSLRIRPVTLADAGSTAALLNRIISSGGLTSMEETLSEEAQSHYILGFPDTELFLQAEETSSGCLAGLQSLEPHRPNEPALAHVGEISTFIAEGFRGQGVGSCLMKATLEAAAGKGYRKVMALIRADNPGALAFYARHRFQRVGLLTAHTRFRDTFLDQVLMERSIPAPTGSRR